MAMFNSYVSLPEGNIVDCIRNHGKPITHHISLLYDVIPYAYSVYNAHQKYTHHQMQSFYHSNPIMI